MGSPEIWGYTLPGGKKCREAWGARASLAVFEGLDSFFECSKLGGPDNLMKQKVVEQAFNYGGDASSAARCVREGGGVLLGLNPQVDRLRKSACPHAHRFSTSESWEIASRRRSASGLVRRTKLAVSAGNWRWGVHRVRRVSSRGLHSKERRIRRRAARSREAE